MRRVWGEGTGYDDVNGVQPRRAGFGELWKLLLLPIAVILIQKVDANLCGWHVTQVTFPPFSSNNSYCSNLYLWSDHYLARSICLVSANEDIVISILKSIIWASPVTQTPQVPAQLLPQGAAQEDVHPLSRPSLQGELLFHRLNIVSTKISLATVLIITANRSFASNMHV